MGLQALLSLQPSLFGLIPTAGKACSAGHIPLFFCEKSAESKVFFEMSNGPLTSA